MLQLVSLDIPSVMTQGNKADSLHWRKLRTDVKYCTYDGVKEKEKRDDLFLVVRK